MSTQSLKELVDAIKTQGKTIANASGTTARDMVYLSTAVERIYGADALIEMTDQASKPVEAIECTLATEQARTLTGVQVSKAVIKLTNTSGTHTATEYVLTVPLKGVAFVVDNKLPVPVKLKTAAQTTNIPSIAANTVGWVYCEGTEVKFVVDTAAISSAVTTPTTTGGDMIYREGAPSQTTQNISVHVRNYGVESYYYLRPTNGYDLNNFNSNFDKTPEFNMYPGITYVFDVSDASNTGHVFSFSTTSDGTHNSGVALDSWDATTTVHVTRSGTEGTANATVTVAVPATPNVTTVYYYSGGTDSSTFDTVGMGGQINVTSTTGVTRLGIGAKGSILGVDGFNQKPKWIKNKEAFHMKVAGLTNDIRGLNFDGKYKMANEITDASTFPYAANVGTYDAVSTTHIAYRKGAAMVFNNGKVEISQWGIGTEGSNGASGQVNTVFSVPGINKNVSATGGHGKDADISDLEHSDVIQIQTSYAHSAFVLANGDVYITGHGDEGQQGDGANADRAFFHKVNFPSGAGRVKYITFQGGNATVYGNCFALMEDGDVYAWGYNAHGQLGIGNANNQNTPQKITTFDKNVKSIQATCPRYTHVVALTTDNKLYTWGYNGYGQLGSGNTSDAYSPVERTISGQVPVKVIGTSNGSYGQTWVLMASGRVYSCGYNAYGQLGHGNTTTPVNTFTQVVGNIGTDTNKYAIDIFSSGGAHFGDFWMLTNDGRLYGVGRNYNGSLGIGSTTTNITTPTICNDKLTWVSQIVSAGNTSSTSYPYGWAHFLSHKTVADRAAGVNGYVYATGYFTNAICGVPGGSGAQGTPMACALPQGVQGNVIQISNRGIHTTSTQEGVGMALDANGDMYSWGMNPAGRQNGEMPNNQYVPWKMTH